MLIEGDNSLTIVNSTRSLGYYPILHIDSPTIDLFHQAIPAPNPQKNNHPRLLINLLDCYLGVTKQSISFISLSKKSTNEIFAGFVGALWSDSFVECSDITRDSYTRFFYNGLKSISNKVPSIISDIDKKAAMTAWERLETCQFKREYYRGWKVSGKTGLDDRHLKLAWVWNQLGDDATRNIHKAAADYVQGYQGLGNHLPLLNELLYYIEAEYPQICKDDLADSLYTTKLIEGFCRTFFERQDSGNLCLETAKKRWNDAIDFIYASLVGSGVFAKPYRKFPYIPPSRKHGSETKISVSEEGATVKDNLITEVPLHITDEEAIKFLFHSIHDDVNTVIKWAQKQADSIYKRHVEKKSKFNHMDFDLSCVKIKQKYKISKKIKHALGGLAYQLGLPTSYSLEPFMFLLINEDPRVTEAFLNTLELYNKRGDLVGLESPDAGTHLVGYKRRKGGGRAQQKILLNQKSKLLVDQIIEITDPLRKYLKAKGDDNYRYLFLSCIRGFSYPQIVSGSLTSHSQAAFNARVEQFLDIKNEWDQQQARNFALRLSPTKFRATRGVQVYLETRSVKAMSEALGHTKFKPDLLSHYLPEPILLFFQSRWVRIFQKGIICEAMKDSPLLLRASNFKTMKELDQFLSKHTFELLPDSEDNENNEPEESSQVYISIDQNILTALLSIESAVASAVKEVTPKALYWAKFSSCLKTEIEKNSYDKDMSSALDHAKNNIDTSMMDGLIYA